MQARAASKLKKAAGSDRIKSLKVSKSRQEHTSGTLTYAGDTRDANLKDHWRSGSTAIQDYGDNNESESNDVHSSGMEAGRSVQAAALVNGNLSTSTRRSRRGDDITFPSPVAKVHAQQQSDFHVHNQEWQQAEIVEHKSASLHTQIQESNI